MKLPSLFAAALLGTAALAATATPSFAFCGVIEESASSYKVRVAVRTADRQADRKIRQLFRQHGRKLVLDKRVKSCVGGALAIDANGNQTEGPSRCTTTVPFCVNP
ncbi:MAG: hypothetical protein GYA66_05065 [Phyllobacteriaceae bacterium]|jgi:hypothetical protein|nr:hypothetical protein [Phyllobacteriaceae bacterium]